MRDDMATATSKKGPARWLALVVASAAAGCAGPLERIPPGEPGCEIEALGEGNHVIAEYRIVGGVGGFMDHDVIFDDGRIERHDLDFPGADPVVLEAAGGAAAAVDLRAELEATGAASETPGCYHRADGAEMTDSMSVALVLHLTGEAQIFEGVVPEPVAEARNLVSAYVREAVPGD